MILSLNTEIANVREIMSIIFFRPLNLETLLLMAGGQQDQLHVQ